MSMDLPLPATTPIRARFAAHLELAKPGIIMGNSLALAGGYFLGAGAQDGFRLAEFSGALTGIALVVASAGAINNVVDRDIDQLMERTRERPMARGDLPMGEALVVSSLLGALGFAILAWTTNWQAMLAALAGFGVYVFLYSLWFKRRSVHGTLVGSVSGAMPPLVGYLAATGAFDRAALLLALAFAFWQMPHSWAIGIFRDRDYRAAGIPLLSVVRGASSVHASMTAYAGAFAGSVVALAALPVTGIVFDAAASAVAVGWFAQVAFGSRRDGITWARRVFFASLLVVVVLSVSLAIDGSLR
jgi:protoheme IX farnesyltransferase